MSIFTCTVHHNTVVFFTELNGGNDLGSMFFNLFYRNLNLILTKKEQLVSVLF